MTASAGTNERANVIMLKCRLCGRQKQVPYHGNLDVEQLWTYGPYRPWRIGR